MLAGGKVEGLGTSALGRTSTTCGGPPPSWTWRPFDVSSTHLSSRRRP